MDYSVDAQPVTDRSNIQNLSATATGGDANGYGAGRGGGNAGFAVGPGGLKVPAGLSDREADIYRRAYLDARRGLDPEPPGFNERGMSHGPPPGYGAGRGHSRYDAPVPRPPMSYNDEYRPPRSSGYGADPMMGSVPPLPPAPVSMLPCKYGKLAQGNGDLILPRPVSKWTEIPLTSFHEGAMVRSIIDQSLEERGFLAMPSGTQSSPQGPTPTAGLNVAESASMARRPAQQQEGVAGLLSLTAALAAAEAAADEREAPWKPGSGGGPPGGRGGGTAESRRGPVESRYNPLAAATTSVYRSGEW